MKILKAGLLYFAVVFGAGFMLGIIRTLWVVPSVGTRTAELIEMPFMLVVIILAAKFVIKRYNVRPAPARLGVGLVAFVMLLATEFTLVLWLRGLSIAEYFATRDPVSGTAYYAMLVIFLFTPLFLGLEPTPRVRVKAFSTRR
jgi:hypothetical protein